MLGIVIRAYNLLTFQKTFKVARAHEKFIMFISHQFSNMPRMTFLPHSDSGINGLQGAYYTITQNMQSE
jgi:hypothetical protein